MQGGCSRVGELIDNALRELQDLLCITGSIDTNRGDIEGYNGFKNALLSARQHNLEHEVLTGDQVNARFPGYNLPSDFMVGLGVCPSLHSIPDLYTFGYHIPDVLSCLATQGL